PARTERSSVCIVALLRPSAGARCGSTTHTGRGAILFGRAPRAPARGGGDVARRLPCPAYTLHELLHAPPAPRARTRARARRYATHGGRAVLLRRRLQALSPRRV